MRSVKTLSRAGVRWFVVFSNWIQFMFKLESHDSIDNSK